MLFVTLAKFKRKPSKEDLEAFDEALARAQKKGFRMKGDYYTFGRFDNVMITEAPDMDTVMKFFLSLTDVVSTETLGAVPKSKGRRLLK